eukprot:3075933-Alexandrium_andersonii.AAC.1
MSASLVGSEMCIRDSLLRCQDNAPCELLNLLAQLLVVVPDVGVKERMVVPVHRSQELAVQRLANAAGRHADEAPVH